MMKNELATLIDAFENTAAKLAVHVRKGEVSNDALNDLLGKIENDLRHARRMYFVDKRDPKKVKAAVKKAAATRKEWKKKVAKWDKEIAAEHAARLKRAAEGYLPEEVCNNHGEPNPRYYEFAYTDERSGGYRIYRLRPEYRNIPGLFNVTRYV